VPWLIHRGYRYDLVARPMDFAPGFCTISTAFTPGIFSASLVSMLVTRACA
jgi:hypothetical protein